MQAWRDTIRIGCEISRAILGYLRNTGMLCAIGCLPGYYPNTSQILGEASRSLSASTFRWAGARSTSFISIGLRYIVKGEPEVSRIVHPDSYSPWKLTGYQYLLGELRTLYGLVTARHPAAPRGFDLGEVQCKPQLLSAHTCCL